MSKQCSSCGGFCGSVCERENVKQEPSEPVAKLFGTLPVYDTTPQQRTWVGLTDEDELDWDGGDLKSLITAVEAKLKEKNT